MTEENMTEENTAEQETLEEPTRTAQPGPSRFRAPLIVILPALAMLGMALWGLGRDSAMSNDETATRYSALLPLHRLWHLLDHLDAVHGFYYLLMHFYMRIVGKTPTIMRVPSVIALVVAVAIVAIIARRLTGSNGAGLFAGLIVAFTPFVSYYAQTARSYALVYLVAVGMTYLFIRVLEIDAAEDPAARPKLVRRLVAYGVLTTVIGYLNELALLLLVAHAVTLLLVRSGRRVWEHWLAAAVPGAVLVIPLIIISHRESAVLNVLKRPTLNTVAQLYKAYFGDKLSIAILLGLFALVALIPFFERLGAAPDDAAQVRPGGLTLAKVAAPILLVPSVVLLVESKVGKPLYTDRYLLYAEMGAALLAGAGIDRVGRLFVGHVRTARLGQPVRWAIGVIVCAAVLVVQLPAQEHIRTPNSRLYNMGGAAQYVAKYKQPRDAVLFLTTFFRKVKLGYPQEFKGVADVALAKSPAAVGNFRGKDKPLPTIEQLLLLHNRVWIVGYAPSVSLPSAESRELLQFVKSHYVVTRHKQFHGVDVTLWRAIAPRS